MFSTDLFLALAVAIGCTTAIDINAFTSGDCSGNAYATCSNIAAQTCCNIISGTHGAHSGKWYHLGNSRKGLQGWQTSGFNSCGSLKKSRVVSGIDKSCMGGIGSAEFSGLSWYNPSSKRSVSTTCEASVFPDIVIVDGVKYCTEGLAYTDLGELLEMARNDTQTISLPPKFTNLACA